MRKQPPAFLLLLSTLSVLTALVTVQSPVVAQGSDPASQTGTRVSTPNATAITTTSPVTGTATVTPTITLPASPAPSHTTPLPISATSSPAVTQTISPMLPVTGTTTVSPTIKSPTLTRTATATPTASQSPTFSPSPSLTPSATPTWTPTAKLPPPTAIATPTPSTGGIIETLQDYGYLIVVGIVLVLVVVLLALFLLWLWRRRGKKMPPAAAHAYLVSSDKPDLIFPIVQDSVTIGRARGCDIQITEKMKLPGVDTLSRWHARLEKRGERWVLIDGGKPNQPSTNGIFVNGMRTRENYLREGVEIRLGQVAFTFHTQLPTAQGGAR